MNVCNLEPYIGWTIYGPYTRKYTRTIL